MGKCSSGGGVLTQQAQDRLNRIDAEIKRLNITALLTSSTSETARKKGERAIKRREELLNQYKAVEKAGRVRRGQPLF